jgi:transcriptional regulator with XRE-family HTH domain
MALGAALRKAREAKGLTASQLAAATRMKVQMVEELEAEDFSRVAAPIYGKGFIRLYAEHVGLDPEPLIQEFVSRYTAMKKTPSLVSERARTPPPSPVPETPPASPKPPTDAPPGEPTPKPRTPPEASPPLPPSPAPTPPAPESPSARRRSSAEEDLFARITAPAEPWTESPAAPFLSHAGPTASPTESPAAPGAAARPRPRDVDSEPSTAERPRRPGSGRRLSMPTLVLPPAIWKKTSLVLGVAIVVLFLVSGLVRLVKSLNKPSRPPADEMGKALQLAEEPPEPYVE